MMILVDVLFSKDPDPDFFWIRVAGKSRTRNTVGTYTSCLNIQCGKFNLEIPKFTD